MGIALDGFTCYFGVAFPNGGTTGVLRRSIEGLMRLLCVLELIRPRFPCYGRARLQ